MVQSPLHFRGCLPSVRVCVGGAHACMCVHACVCVRVCVIILLSLENAIT